RHLAHHVHRPGRPPVGGTERGTPRFRQPDLPSARLPLSLAARRFVFLTAAVLVMAAACVGRVLFEGRRSLEATAQLRETDRRAAIVQARRAAAWYVPFASHVDEAYRELRSLALAAERESDRETAL